MTAPSSLVILGDGQLAQMLLEAASGREKPAVYGSDPASPAGQVAGVRVYATLEEAIQQCDTVLFENEFVDVAEIRTLIKRLGKSPSFVPELDVIAALQDKLGQKRALEKVGIPTTPYVEAKSGEKDETTFLARATQKLGREFVLKWARYGYDGKGVFFFSPEGQPGNLDDARAFFSAARQAGTSVFAEARVPFIRELAITGCRNSSGDFVSYPVVQTLQRSGICHHVLGPVQAAPEAVDWLRKLGDSLGIVGCYTLELFETERGVWVNEIAPRVHNSAHYTQDGSDVSQFALHLQAARGERLAKPHLKKFFGMLNLLGPAGVHLSQSPREAIGEWAGTLTKRGFRPHWYGKSGVRPGRKLGHVNFVADNESDFERKKESLVVIENEFCSLLSSR